MMETILFYQYYKTTPQERQTEIDTCLNNNLENQYIDTIVIFSEEEVIHPKVKWIQYSDRLTYSVWLQTVRELFDGDNHYILCNSDIYFDDTINLLDDFDYRGLILSRYENGELIWNHHDSQDTWIISSTNLIDSELIDQSNFELGKPGCDNAIAWIFNNYGILTGNFSNSIRTHHLHTDTYTNKKYSEKDRIMKPYVFLPSTDYTKRLDKNIIKHYYPW